MLRHGDVEEVELGWLASLFGRSKPDVRKGWRFVSVVGESFDNADGSSRQAILQKLSGRAVAVMSQLGQLGYLGSDDLIKDMVFYRLKDGLPVLARVASINGGTGKKRSMGVTIDVKIDEANEMRRMKRLGYAVE